MAKYYVEYTGYIDERKRPENFQKIFLFRRQYAANTHEELGAHMATEIYNLIESRDPNNNAHMTPGIVVLKDSEATTKLNFIDFSSWRYIPWHMVTHIEVTKVRQIVDPPPKLPGDNTTPEPEDEEPEKVIQ